MKSLRIGCGAGYGGDRVDPAIELAMHGNLDYLVLECLAERTIALAQITKKKNPNNGYGQLLEERMTALLPLCKEKKFAIVTNIGAANPLAALNKTAEIARKLGIGPLKIAALEGANVLDEIKSRNSKLWEIDAPVSEVHDRVISADAYLGVEEMLPALESGADVIITGRVADPSLFLAPMVHSFGWQLDDWVNLGKGTALAHLIECSAQVSGGYFADSYYKKINNFVDIGFPLVEVNEKGEGFVTKVNGTGGVVNSLTCKEQLLYEIGDPASYLTPDVTADFSKIIFKEIGRDKVEVTGARGKERPIEFKITVGVKDGYLGEAFVSYAGHHAVERAKMAQEILEKRYKKLNLTFKRVKYDMMGINALHGSIGEKEKIEPYEVLLRVAVKSENKEMATKAMQEVETLWLNGPGGVGGIRKNINPVLAVYSTTIPRSQVTPKVAFVEVK